MAYTIFRPDDAPIRGVLFDMDGVILDSEKLYAKFWAAACESFGFPMTYEQALGMRSLNRDAGQAYLSSLFGPDIRYPDVRSRRIELMDAYVARNGVEAKPGVNELLDCLQRRNIPFALTTASPMDRIEAHLGSLGLLEKFRHICTAYQVPHGKPEPDIYLLGAKTIGLPAELPGAGGQLHRHSLCPPRRLQGHHRPRPGPAGREHPVHRLRKGGFFAGCH